MRSPVSVFVLTTLLAVGCGARPEPDPPTDTHVTRGSENESTDSARSSDELARDPAWQSIPADGTRVATEAADAGVAAPRCVGACGAEGDSCTDARGWHCRCEWQHDVICGGAYRPPNPPTLGWACAPFDPTADRGDGCPFGAPTGGQPCRVASTRSCRYAPGCGYSGVDAACVGGRWVLAEFHMPPPP
jgi:hypothetical protein